ncbi:MAG: hypothetical protein OEU92_30970 [Alphaproteobacteria bacterium]|nr:hypothetical protein [Alphaproteobacteria bacterium]
MSPKKRDTIEIELVIANDERAEGASGESDLNQLSLVAKLTPIVRLLARQAARGLYQAANDDRDIDQDIPGE